MQSTTRKKIEKYLTWLIVFMLLFFAFQIIFTFDFLGEYKKNKERAKLLVKVAEVEEAYFYISPYWLKRHGISLNSADDILDDQDGDGLNLKQEYQNLTDPFNADTDKDGYSDGEEVRNGYNPLGGGKLDRNKNGLPDFWETENGLSLEKDEAQSDPDEDELTNEQEFFHGTNPNNADSDGDGYKDLNELSHGYDPLVPGSTRLTYEIFIQKLNISAPIILSQNPEEAALLNDLQKGVVLYPQTTIPGEVGNAVINGHSSNFSWLQGQYNYIFKNLNSLSQGDRFEIKMSQANGKSFSYQYIVTSKEIVSSDDQKIFETNTKATVTLVTCWPLNTDLRRLFVKGELIK